MFAAGIYDPVSIPYSAWVFHRKLPLMLIGALKAWLYPVWSKNS